MFEYVLYQLVFYNHFHLALCQAPNSACLDYVYIFTAVCVLVFTYCFSKTVDIKTTELYISVQQHILKHKNKLTIQCFVELHSQVRRYSLACSLCGARCVPLVHIEFVLEQNSVHNFRNIWVLDENHFKRRKLPKKLIKLHTKISINLYLVVREDRKVEQYEEVVDGVVVCVHYVTTFVRILILKYKRSKIFELQTVRIRREVEVVFSARFELFLHYFFF